MKQNRKNLKSSCAFLLALLLLVAGTFSASASGEQKLALGGDLFGVELDLDGVLVSDYAPFESGGKELCPAKDAGLLPGDFILEADGVKTNSVALFSKLISEKSGTAVKLLISRNEQLEEALLMPALSDEDGRYHAGFWAKESLSGVGTLTFYDPKSATFGGLGHGVCEGDVLLPIEKGTVRRANLKSVVKGVSGTPGELRASFEGASCGGVEKNTQCGVFGTISNPVSSDLYPVAGKDEVQIGKAQIRSTVREGESAFYDVEITKICDGDAKTKNFLIKVTDEALLQLTGGIVQGMSGSPIVQNGKLIGAVTHVLVKHPECGYGIFIENMLEAA